jgi:polyphosphate kinase
MKHTQQPALLNRDASLLAFNQRVLSWAQRDDIPVFERLRFLCIVSSNLDEFFEVRGLEQLNVLHAQTPATGAAHPHKAEHHRIFDLAHILVKTQYDIYNNELLPLFAESGLKILSHGERKPEQRRWVEAYFNQYVQPLLTPVALDPAHPFPLVANKSLNFIVQLSGKDAFGRENEIAIIKVPRSLPRVIRLPDRLAKLSHANAAVVTLSSVIRAHLKSLFWGREVINFSQFRVTRHSELAVDEEEVKNLRTALREGLQQRHFGNAVRIEVSASASEHVCKFLLQQYQLPEQALYRVAGPVNLVRLQQIIDLVKRPEWVFPPHVPQWPASWPVEQPVFERLQQGDLLIHQPFESFSAVIRFLREAVNDPNVLVIKQTVYRTGSDSTMMDLLCEAAQRGKEVIAVVELKARFDEEANINWAERLESVGVQVVYGIVGLKTHAKMLLITRREGRHLRRYAHLSTGNYNQSTAKLYTDFSYITADPALTNDVDQVFRHLASQLKIKSLHKLLLAPFHLHTALLAKVKAVEHAAARGETARMVIKTNSLTDETLIHALLEAGQAGAKIDLLVRGACMLPVQIAGSSENIRVHSILGRFLEHSRIFYFQAGEVESLYLSSADWMSRNMFRRIELAWPVDDPILRQRVIDECLVPYLQAEQSRWLLGADGLYTPCPITQPDLPSAQSALQIRFQP